MAERGAHLTATEQERPSIFEVVASDSLQATFYPAIKRLCTVLATAHPDKFSWTIRHYDELFLVLNATVQQYYVRRFDGSLSEIFYGLTRNRSSAPAQLTTKSRCLLFVSLVLLPYVRCKLDALVQRFKDDLERVDAGSTLRQRQLKRLTVRATTVGFGVYECLQVLQYIAYMANRSPSHSLGTRLLHQQLVYMPAELSPDTEWRWSDLWSSGGSRATFLTGAVFRCLELSAFFLQFVRWWQDEASQGSLMRLPVPEAPPLAADSGKYMGICPLCVQSWEIPTAVSISGYVYCYKCIMRHFETVGRTCPVSNYPADVDDLIRVFEV